jgi:hypothetical protein
MYQSTSIASFRRFDNLGEPTHMWVGEEGRNWQKIG